MTTVDSSVLIPAIQRWHPVHGAALALLKSHRDLRLIGHVALETYSRVTGPPAGQPRLTPKDALRLLRQWYTETPLALSPTGYFTMLERVADRGLLGGAVHDARIGATAQENGARLYSRDQRAAGVYAALGVDYEFM